MLDITYTLFSQFFCCCCCLWLGGGGGGLTFAMLISAWSDDWHYLQFDTSVDNLPFIQGQRENLLENFVRLSIIPAKILLIKHLGC